MISFSLESLKSVIVKAVKNPIGTVKSKMRGNINRYSLNSSKNVTSIYAVTRAICMKNTIDIMIKRVLKSDAKEPTKLLNK